MPAAAATEGVVLQPGVDEASSHQIVSAPEGVLAHLAGGGAAALLGAAAARQLGGGAGAGGGDPPTGRGRAPAAVYQRSAGPRLAAAAGEGAALAAELLRPALGGCRVQPQLGGQQPQPGVDPRLVRAGAARARAGVPEADLLRVCLCCRHQEAEGEDSHGLNTVKMCRFLKTVIWDATGF